MKLDFIKFDLNQILTTTMVLFAIIDILGSIPVIIELRRKAGHIQSEKASLVAAGLMVLFLFLGESLLKVIGLDVESFAIAGSFVIFFIAMEMVLGLTIFKEEAPETVSIVPLAFPLIAGAGTMTTLLSLKTEYQTQNILIGILLNILFVYFVLKNTNRLEKLFGKSGLNILRKAFGVILLAIAIKLFRNNTGL
ncbi:MarC family protein [Pedobacter sp.]|uniref:MarC family protein n=1 Tax=Pedobacter sp. TaxID=1411316 RepID=UPI003BABD04D